MTTLEEKVQNILNGSDFNDLPFDERKRIGKYMDEQQILTIWQTLLSNKHLTTDAWRKNKDNGLQTVLSITDKNIANGYNSQRNKKVLRKSKKSVDIISLICYNQ